MLKAIQTLLTKSGKFEVAVRSAFIEVGYNFLVNPSSTKGQDFVQCLKEDLAKQKIQYQDEQFGNILKQVLEKIAREWKITANVPQLINTFQLLE